jgi:hypothetical protein
MIKEEKMKSKKSVWMSVLIVAVVSLSVMVPPAALAEGPLHIMFSADRARIHPGECALLEWHVEGGFVVELNGQQVQHIGHKQVCPQQTKVFRLGVDAGDRVEVREVAIIVEGSGQPPQSPPPQQPAPSKPAPKPGPKPSVMINFRADRTNLKAGECTILRWDVEHANEVYLDGKGVVGHSSKKVCPKVAHTFVLHVTHNGGPTEKKVTIHLNGGGAPKPPQPGKPSTDLAVTDLYADKKPKGAVWVRVTNRGPATLTNAKIEMKCNSYGNPLGGQKPWQHTESPWLKTVSLKPGQTATFKTKMTVDTSKYQYSVTCAVSPPSKGAKFSESNWSNNNYTESIASNTKTKVLPGSSPRADLAVTDLFPTKMRGGKLFARITNRGPATLKNFKVQLSCQGAGWKGGSATNIQNGKTVTLNLSHGQTAKFDTGITINIDQFNYYEMTCRVKGALNDPNPNNNAYSELIQ